MKLNYFTKFEKILWISSVILITVSFILFDRTNYMSLFASLIGTTALIFNAKGNPVGPFMLIAFCILYGIISFGYAYYGETITYVGMSLPMAIVSFVTWIRNPYKGKKTEVTVKDITKKEITVMIILTVVVTIAFYFILGYFNTKNLIPSTLSITTSFIAAFLSARRSPYFALAYAVNDIVLMVLWVLATIDDITYMSVTICFVVFLGNDLYSFISWLKMQKRQKA